MRGSGHREPASVLLAGVDTGGTFTDIVVAGSGGLRLLKVPSSRIDPGGAALAGLRSALGPVRAEAVVHGSTVATNALLTGSVARTALVTTAGFEDVVEIGRQERPQLYDLDVEKPRAPAPRGARFGVRERTLASGRIEVRAEPGGLGLLAARLRSAGFRAAAVGFLHSYANPANERVAEGALCRAGIAVTASHRLLREHREYERFTTALVNASLLPLMGGYLRKLGARVPARSLRVMQSNGGSISSGRAAMEPVRTILSGPAAGAIAAAEAARRAGFPGGLALDMGGTSTDVSFSEGGEVRRRAESVVAGLPVRLPALDIVTVGAGGGSIVRAEAGALRVGPESAGADPGPACYGKGDRPTVTDANLVLGLLDEDSLLGGAMQVDRGQAERALRRVGEALGLRPREAARGVREVVNSVMLRALRAVSVERGEDPRGGCLVAFGGAGPLHAADLAGALGIRAVIVPLHPGLLSALGLLMAPVVTDHARTLLAPVRGSDAQIRDGLRELRIEAREVLLREGFRGTRAQVELTADLRYEGQSYEIEVPVRGRATGRALRAAFEAAHRRLYGSDHPGRGVECVALRARGVGRPQGLPRSRRARHLGQHPERVAVRKIGLGPGWARTAVAWRERMESGTVLDGPAIVREYSATTVVPPGWTATVLPGGDLLLSRVSR